MNPTDAVAAIAAVTAALPLDPQHPALHTLRGAGFSSERIAQVLAFYDESHRHYHNRLHLHEMFDMAHSLGLELRADEALAILFHDAVYVPGAARGANETGSAQLLRVYAGGMSATLVDSACQTVLATSDHVPEAGASRLVLDLDLMRLGVDYPAFDFYSRQVFAEQRALLPTADDEHAWFYFEACRVKFFKRLLGRSHIYALPAFRDRFEDSARRNMERSIAEVRRRGRELTADVA